MSVVTVCDWCGRNIADGDDDATFSVSYGPGWTRRSRSGWLGHFHDGCADQFLVRLDLVWEAGRSIERIPVASGQKIGQLKRKHVKPAEGGASC